MTHEAVQSRKRKCRAKANDQRSKTDCCIAPALTAAHITRSAGADASGSRCSNFTRHEWA